MTVDPVLLEAHGGAPPVDVSAAPDWWLSGADEAERFLRALPGVELVEFGRSAGGRPLLAACHGRREDLPGRTSNSLGSALSGGSAAAFYGSGRRNHQSLLFVGNAHGLEFEGTVAALHMLNVLITGHDLRGRAWPRMQDAGRDMRIVLIPHLNIDGRERFREVRHEINVGMEVLRHLSQGEWKDGTKLEWPNSKRVTPLPPREIAVMGAYFNDNGVNLVYDTGLGVEPQPETHALLRLARAEMPDAAVLSHTNNGSLVCDPDAFIPERFRLRQAQIGALVGTRCRYAGLCKSAIPSRPYQYAGEVLYQSDLVYHACGALPIMVEFPCGYQNVPSTFDEILDIGLHALEEILCFGAAYGFRPIEK